MRVFFAALLIIFAGCLPSTRVIKNPCDSDQGVRFYRPKPYLFLKPHTERDGKNPSEKFVEIELQMLPDFTEEYSLHIRSGLGTNDTSVTLDGGWNLTQLNVNIDSKFEENVAAISEGMAKMVKSEGGGGGDSQVVGRSIVPATNVPLGYYESVISRGADGVRRMYGWRYIGFSPYAYCPEESCGVDCQPNCELRELYGLVFENGVMTFKQLSASKTANNIPLESEFQRSLKKFEDSVALKVPVLLDALNIKDVSPQKILVTSDVTSETIDVNAELNEAQFAAYQKSNVTNFQISEAISKSFAGSNGEDIMFAFRVTKEE